MKFICEDFAYGAENLPHIFIFIAIALLIRKNSLGCISCGRQKVTGWKSKWNWERLSLEI